LFGDGHTICEEDKNTSDSHEDLNPLVICFHIFEVPNKISSLNIFLYFRIYILTSYSVELDISTFLLHISIALLIFPFLFLQFVVICFFITPQIFFKILQITLSSLSHFIDFVGNIFSGFYLFVMFF
jgi:hypothetical protein